MAMTFLALVLEIRRNEPATAAVKPAILEALPRPATLFCLVMASAIEEELGPGKVKLRQNRGDSTANFIDGPDFYF